MEVDQERPTPGLLAPSWADWKDIGDPEENTRAELRGTLLSSLQMEHLVVLAGSGCSIATGGPSMADLWQAVCGADGVPNAGPAIKALNFEDEDQNVEALMSRAEAFLQVHDDTAIEEFLAQAKAKILYECSCFLDDADLDAHRTFLHRLARRRVRDQRLKIFTTNYDLCFERAAGAIGGVALDGFSFTSPRRYDPRYFEYDIIRRPRSGDEKGDYLEGVFMLHKLHGSVNWARRSDGIFETERPSPAEACLIYPAAGKYHQSFSQPHLESVAEYLAALRQPNTCVVTVGFGFNDDHLSEPVVAAVASNPHLRLLVVDLLAREKAGPTPDNRHWARLREHSARGEDVWFIAMDFRECAASIPVLKSLSPAASLIRVLQDVAAGE